MRIEIESDIQTIDDLTAELVSQPDTEIEPSEVASDLGEQKFGFAEVAAIVAIVKGVCRFNTRIRP